MKYYLTLLLLSIVSHSYCQIINSDSLNKSSFDPTELSSKSLAKLGNGYASLDKSIQDRSESLLERLQKKESKLKRKVEQKDSVKASVVFANSDKKYQELEAQVKSPSNGSINSTTTSLKEYDPNVDSVQTALLFIQQKGINLPDDKMQQVQTTSGQLQQLQGQLKNATDVQTFVKEREQLLKDQVSQYGQGELADINKESYYYQQQIVEYKGMLKDKKQLEQEALSVITSLPAFKNFMQQNSYLSQLFPVPANNGTPLALVGLQTNASTQQQIENKYGLSNMPSDDGGGGGNGMAILQQEVQQAQTVISALKDKVNNAGGGSSDMVIPDFAPNTQKTKSLFHRLEYGFNIQSQKSTSFLPTISDLALTIGYKLSDKATIGVGASYQLGWGSGSIGKIHFSNQGIGLRSYIDIKAKGSIWITGGYEYNYMQEFANLHTIYNLDVWQKSALIGLTKKYKIGKQENNIQILYDLLAGKEIPRSSPFKFRTGFTF